MDDSRIDELDAPKTFFFKKGNIPDSETYEVLKRLGNLVNRTLRGGGAIFSSVFSKRYRHLKNGNSLNSKAVSVKKVSSLMQLD